MQIWEFSTWLQASETDYHRRSEITMIKATRSHNTLQAQAPKEIWLNLTISF